jgi:hypothetical protein
MHERLILDTSRAVLECHDDRGAVIRCVLSFNAYIFIKIWVDFASPALLRDNCCSDHEFLHLIVILMLEFPTSFEALW